MKQEAKEKQVKPASKANSSKAKSAGVEKRVVVRQTRSLIGRDPSVRRTMRALGLGRIGSEHEHTLSASVVGMIRRVEHLVTLHEVH